MNEKRITELSEKELREFVAKLPDSFIEYLLNNKDKPFETLKAYIQGFHDGGKFTLDELQRVLNKY